MSNDELSVQEFSTGLQELMDGQPFHFFGTEGLPMDSTATAVMAPITEPPAVKTDSTALELDVNDILNSVKQNGFSRFRAILGNASAELDLAEAGGRHTPEECLIDVCLSTKRQLDELNTDHYSAGEVFTPHWNNKPVSYPPTILWSGIPVCHPGNITLITSAAGSGKSSICEAHCSAAVSPGCDSLSITVNAPVVKYIDTERSNQHSYDSWTRFVRRSDITMGTDVDKVIWKNIRGISSYKAKQNWLFSAIAELPETALIILDGLGDVISDVNDTETVSEFTSHLCAVIHVKNLSCLLTLHNNPVVSSQKARGVLGSEIWRKAQCAAIIENTETDIRRLTTNYTLGKNRAGHDNISIAFRWCDEKKMHVSCEETTPINNNKTQTMRNAIIMAMENNLWSYSDLRRLVMDKCGKSSRTSERIIADLAEIKKVKKVGEGYRAASGIQVVSGPDISLFDEKT